MRLKRAARAGVRFGPIANGVLMKKLGIALAIAIAAAGAAHAADLPTKKEAAAGSAGELLCEHMDLARLDAGRLSAELGPLHRLRDA